MTPPAYDGSRLQADYWISVRPQSPRRGRGEARIFCGAPEFRVRLRWPRDPQAAAGKAASRSGVPSLRGRWSGWLRPRQCGPGRNPTSHPRLEADPPPLPVSSHRLSEGSEDAGQLLGLPVLGGLRRPTGRGSGLLFLLVSMAGARAGLSRGRGAGRGEHASAFAAALPPLLSTLTNSPVRRWGPGSKQGKQVAGAGCVSARRGCRDC